MLFWELPNLEDTQSGKDLIQIGEARGLNQAIVLLLQARFGRVTKALQARIEGLSADEAKELITQMATWVKMGAWSKLQDTNDWLDHRGK